MAGTHIAERLVLRTAEPAPPIVSAPRPSTGAYQLLRLGFAVAPILAGIDKFFHLLTNWDMYLAQPVERILGGTAHTFMLAVGAIEILAGLLVAIVPRVGAWIVALWLGGITVNLLLPPGFYDIALRDFALMLGAIALGLLAREDNPPEARKAKA